MDFENFLMHIKEIVVEEDCENIDEVKEGIIKEYKFKLPIEYCNHKKLNDVVKADLELDEAIILLIHYFMILVIIIFY